MLTQNVCNKLLAYFSLLEAHWITIWGEMIAAYLSAYINFDSTDKFSCSYKLLKILKIRKAKRLRIRKATTFYDGFNQNDNKG